MSSCGCIAGGSPSIHTILGLVLCERHTPELPLGLIGTRLVDSSRATSSVYYSHKSGFRLTSKVLLQTSSSLGQQSASFSFALFIIIFSANHVAGRAGIFRHAWHGIGLYWKQRDGWIHIKDGIAVHLGSRRGLITKTRACFLPIVGIPPWPTANANW